MKRGDLGVVVGTGEVYFCIKPSGKGYYSQRLKEGTVGEIEVVGHLNQEQQAIYRQRHNPKGGKKK